MLRADKERVVEELAERLRSTSTLMVADYRGLSMPEIEELRARLLEAGARFTVVKNSLTKRAAEAAGTEEVLELIEGPTAIAFLDADGDPAAVAKVLNDTAKAHEVLVLRGGLLDGTVVGDEEIKRLATLPSAEVLRAQLAGAVLAPLTTVVGLFTAPLRDLVGVVDARIRQLENEPRAEPSASGGGRGLHADSEASQPEEQEEQSEEPSAEAEQASAESEEETSGEN